MQHGGSTYKRMGLFLGLFILPLLMASCSVQKSGSRIDSSHANDNTKVVDASSVQTRDRDNASTLKVDYLTPLSAIRQPKIYVYKEKRRLYVIQSSVLVRDYPIGLGINPRGDKQRQGDGRTPEGEFSICVKNPMSRFVKSLGLDYPDRKHAERALFAGIITPLEFQDIIRAFASRAAPPWNTALGGEIFIHAGGAHNDWTDGCVALYDSDMEELFTIASVGTPVTIRP